MENKYKIVLGGLMLWFFSVSGEAQAQTTGLKLGSNPGTKDQNAILDLSGTTTQGVLLPRVALTGTANSAPLAGTVTSGMLVYNTATADDVTPGVYFSNGTQWVRVASNGAGGMIQAPSTSLTSTTNPTGTTGQVLYNTNAAAGVPVGLVVWNGSEWAPASGSTADGDAWGVTGEDPNSSIFRNGNVGIGVAPRESFDIRKGFTFHTGGNLGMFWNAYYDGGLKYGGYGGSNFSGTIDFSPSSGDMYFNTSIASGTEGADVTQRNLLSLRQSGNVGIGTISPTSKLHVEGIYNSGTMLNLNQSTPSWGSAEVFNAFRYIQTNMANGDFKQFNVGGGGVSIGYNTVPTYGSSDALYVNGNVGIGTETPFEKLELRNGVLQSKQTLDYAVAGSRDLLILGLNKSHGNFGSISSYVWQAEKEANGGSIKLNLLAQAADGTYGSNYDNANVARSNAMTFFNGNIGVGTNSPTANLHVMGTAKLEGTATNSGYLEFARSGQASRDGYLGYGNNGGIDFVSEVGSKPITILTNNGNILLGPGTGNVGIGTTTPAAKLDINGSSNLRGLITTSEAIELGGLGSGDRFSFIDFHSQDGQDYNARIVREPGANGVFNIINGSSLLTLNTAGNIGIGTSSPTAKLEVAGNARIQTLPAGSGTDDVVTTDANGNLRKMPASTFTGATGPQGPAGPQGATGPAGSNATADGDAWAVTGEDQTSAIGRIGNVGIGTTTPSQKLTISGNGNVLGIDNTASFVAKNSSGNYESFLVPRWNDDVMYLDYGANGFNIRNNSMSPTMFMTNGGSVGIGTETPFTKLELRNGVLQSKQTMDYAVAGSRDLLILGVNKNHGDFGFVSSYVWQAEKEANGGSIKLNLLAQAANGTYGSNYDNDNVTRTNAMTFFNGNIGMGTNSPTANLHVLGTAKLEGTTTNSGYLEFARSGQASRDGYIGYGNNGNGGLELVSQVSLKPIQLLTENGNIILGPGTGNVGINNSTPTSKLQVSGSFATAINNAASSITLNETHNTLTLDLTSGNATVTLPAANTCGGRIYHIVRTDGSSNVLTFSAAISLGNTTFTTSNIPGATFIIQSDGSNWRLISN